MTILAPDGAGPVVFPVDANVGDYYRAANDVTYELMPNLRWRNVIPLGDGIPPDSPFGPPQGGDGPSNVISELVIGGPSPAAGPLNWWNYENYDQGPGNPYMLWYADSVLPLPAKNVIYPKTVQAAVGQNFTWILDETFTDPDILFQQYIPPQWQKIGQTVYAPGNGISAFNRPTRYTCGLELADYIGDMSRRDEVQMRFSFYQGRTVGGTTIDGTSVEIKQFPNTEADFNYENTGGNQEIQGRTWFQDYSDTLANPIPWRYIQTDWQPIDALAQAIYFVINLRPGQIIADIRLDIIDPTVGSTDPSYRVHQGLGFSRNGDKMYIARPDTLEDPSMLEYDLATPYDLNTASFNTLTTQFDDSGSLGVVTPDSASTDRGGFRLIFADTARQRLRSYGLRDESVVDMATDDLSGGWDWSEQYQELITIGLPKYAQWSHNGDKAISIEDDTILRVYDTGGAYDFTLGNTLFSSVDLSALGTFECFWISATGKTIIIPVTGGYYLGTMETEYDVSNIVWNPIVNIAIDNPTGIFVTPDFSTMLLTEVPADVDIPVKVSTYVRDV